MLYNDKQAQKHYKQNCIKLEHLFIHERVNDVIKERFAPHFRGEIVDSYDDWYDLALNYPSYDFSVLPFMTSNKRMFYHRNPQAQEKLRSYQVIALKQYRNTLISKKANVERILAHCRAIGYQDPVIRPMRTFKKSEDTHYILTVREALK